MAPILLKTAHDGPKVVPRWSQDGAGMAQDGSNIAQYCPKMLQNDHKMAFEDGFKNLQIGVHVGRQTCTRFQRPLDGS